MADIVTLALEELEHRGGADALALAGRSVSGEADGTALIAEEQAIPTWRPRSYLTEETPVGTPYRWNGQVYRLWQQHDATGQPGWSPDLAFSLWDICHTTDPALAKDYDTLAAFVHPEEGVTFTPYSTVDRDSDLRFTAAQVRQFSTDQTVYTWGVSDGLGSLIELTPAEYFSTYVFNTDYTQAPEIGVDRILQSGNALENLTEAYPGCRFVEFHFPGLDPANAGLDWCSLKLVFSPSDSCWQLVGIIHSQWTI